MDQFEDLVVAARRVKDIWFDRNVHSLGSENEIWAAAINQLCWALAWVERSGRTDD